MCRSSSWFCSGHGEAAFPTLSSSFAPRSSSSGTTRVPFESVSPLGVSFTRIKISFARHSRHSRHPTIAFVTLLPAAFWHYFTALGALLAVTCLDSPALRFTAMGFYLASSIWAPAGAPLTLQDEHDKTRPDPTQHTAQRTLTMDDTVTSGLLRVISAGVCVVWYERDSPADDGGPVRSEPTRFFLRQSLLSSFNAIALAAVLGFDLRTFRASFVAYRYLSLSLFLSFPSSRPTFIGLVVAGTCQEALLQFLRTCRGGHRSHHPLLQPLRLHTGTCVRCIYGCHQLGS